MSVRYRKNNRQSELRGTVQYECALAVTRAQHTAEGDPLGGASEVASGLHAARVANWSLL